ncbi:MAG: phosphodiester glycosidase family protein, partial [Bryobacter sp.]|nr:phosphodiester glycosidase family protein [Bryobacter sp.]
TAPSGASAAITGLNRARGAQDLLVYQPSLGPRTLTDNSGVEAVLDAAGRVTQLRNGEGNSDIPSDGVVLSGSGAGANWLRANAQPGTLLTISLALQPSAPSPDCDPLDIAGGGPRLVSDGKVNVTAERFGHENTRNPRTASAITRRGTLLFLTLDGRQPASAGMRLEEFAEELLRWDAVEAMNLDGGGSSVLITRDRIRNSPSDGTERAVSDAILIHSIANKQDLSDLLSTLGDQVRAEALVRLRSALAESVEAFREALAAVDARDISVAALRLLRESAACL